MEVMTMMPWMASMTLLTDETPNWLSFFTIDEFRCSHCGQVLMSEDFLACLDELRENCGFPFDVSSGFRCPQHPEEVKKEKPGTHNGGIAADIRVYNGFQRRKVVEEALKMGVFNGIGVSKTFVHVDIRDEEPVMWTYGT
jgi:zinc D-Ala-D-Ala carboxypeptidase